MVSSGTNVILVPLRREVSSRNSSSFKVPRSNSAEADLLSRVDSTLKYSESAFTALVPTPLSPTDFLNARESYLPPVFILETTSTTLPNGIPRP